MLVFKSNLKPNQTLRTQVGATAMVGTDQISLPGSDTVVYLGQQGYQPCAPARVKITTDDGTSIEGKITLRNLQINPDFAPTTYDRNIKGTEIFYYMVVAHLGNQSIEIGDIVCISAEEVENLSFVANTRLRHVRPVNDLAHLTPAVYTIDTNGKITKDEVKAAPVFNKGSGSTYKGFNLKVRVEIEGTDLVFNTIEEAQSAIDVYTKFNQSLTS